MHCSVRTNQRKPPVARVEIDNGNLNPRTVVSFFDCGQAHWDFSSDSAPLTSHSLYLGPTGRRIRIDRQSNISVDSREPFDILAHKENHVILVCMQCFQLSRDLLVKPAVAKQGCGI
jgi:hypothetical protein